jgi:hypothetical protein
MRKLVVGIAVGMAVVYWLAAAGSLAAIAGWVHRGPMNHGWEWPGHDWWHSQSAHSQLRQHGPATTETRRVGLPDGSTSNPHEMKH